jgi:hypothetical protein
MLLSAASRYRTSLSPEREERETDVLLSHRLTGRCKMIGDSARFPGGDNDDFRLLGCDVVNLEEVK